MASGRRAHTYFHHCTKEKLDLSGENLEVIVRCQYFAIATGESQLSFSNIEVIEYSEPQNSDPTWLKSKIDLE